MSRSFVRIFFGQTAEADQSARSHSTMSTAGRTFWAKSAAKDNEPWFAVKDLAATLGFKDAFSATEHLDDDEKLNRPVAGIHRGLIFINESGLYSLILKSRKPEAKAFKKWATSVWSFQLSARTVPI